jgi:hypothetical protein
MSAAVLALKPVLYALIFIGARALTLPPVSKGRVFWATLTRLAGGILLGLPFGATLMQLPEPAAHAIFAGFRLLLWTACLKGFFRTLPWGRLLAVAAGATLLNAILDVLFWGRSWTGISIC